MMIFIDEQIHALSGYFQTGGPIMIPLLFFSLLAWLLIANRWFFLRRMEKGMMSAAEIWERISRNELPQPSEGGITGHFVRLFLQERTGNPLLDRQILNEVLLITRKPLKNFLPLIGVLAMSMPLLGLLGTVTGMMNTFEVMAHFGTGDAKGMASGISEALITTETGLIIAIPVFYIKNYLDGLAQRIEHHLTSIGYYLRRHLQGEKKNVECQR